jgi:hypothetical protein
MRQADPELMSCLEHAQLSHFKQQNLPRRRIGKGVLTLLILLRLYVFLAIPLVAYAFIHALSH